MKSSYFFINFFILNDSEVNMSRSLITLDNRGLVDDADQKIERVLAYMLVTEASQSNVHRDFIISIPDIIRKHGADTIAIKEAMSSALDRAFSSYFDNVLIDVNVEPSNLEPGKLNLLIQAKVEQDGQWHDVAKALTATNDTVKLVTEFDNY